MKIKLSKLIAIYHDLFFNIILVFISLFLLEIFNIRYLKILNKNTLHFFCFQLEFQPIEKNKLHIFVFSRTKA